MLTRLARVASVAHVAGAVVTLAACTAPRPAIHLAPHSLFVDAEGRARRTLDSATATIARPSGEPLDSAALATQLGAMMRTVRAHPGREVVVYVHGGLEPHVYSARQARYRIDAMRRAGIVPLFLHWDSSPAPARSVAALPGIALGGTLGAPGEWGRQYVAACRTAHALVADDATLPTAARRCPGHAPDATERASLAVERARAAGDDTLAALHIAPHRPGALVTAARTALGVATAIPKLATGPYMRAAGASTYEALRTRALRAATGAGAALADSLGALLDAECPRVAAPAHTASSPPPSSAPPCARRLTLVGFSMGSIVVDAMLRARPALRVHRIVHLAPAASIDETLAAVVPALRANPEATFRLATLHPQAEADELRTLDLLPRGSLLEWIDAAWGADASSSTRTTGRWSGALALSALVPAELRARIAVEAFGADPATRARTGRAITRHAALGHPRFAFWADSTWATAPRVPPRAPR